VTVLALTVIPSIVPRAAAQDVLWTRQFGTSANDRATAVAVDASGVYFAGFTPGTLPGQTSAGGLDAFLRKYDGSGNEVWTRQFGTPVGDNAYAVAVDASGIYVAGSTGGTLPGQTSAGASDPFLRQYDRSGNEVWTRQFGTPSVENAQAVAVDASGIYVAGSTGGTFPGQTSAGSYDAFLRKYDRSGNEVWTRQFGSLNVDLALAVTVDASGISVAGTTYGTLPGQTSAGGSDAFLRTYDGSGNEVWTRQFGTSTTDFAYAVAANASGVHVAGYTDGTLPGQTSAGASDPFLRQYDGSGNEVWTRQFGTPSIENAQAVAVDASGIYVAGFTGGTFPGQASAGGLDAFLRKYDGSGNEVWTRQFGTPGSDSAYAVAVDASGVYVAGDTGGTFPGQTSAGSDDAFLVRVVEAPDSPQSLLATASDRRVVLTWDAPAFEGRPQLTAYRVYRGTTPGVVALVAVLDAGIRRYVDLDVANGVTYYYAVTGTNGIGETPPTNVSAMPKGPPPLALTSPAEGLLTNRLAVNVSGTTESGATVTVDGASVAVDPAGAFNTSVALVEGPNVITVVATDAGGNTATVTRSVTRDSTSPSLTVAAPLDGSLWPTSIVRVAGTAEPGADLSLNGIRLTVDAAGAWQVDLALADGVHAITARAVDAAGNAATVTRTITVDTILPVLTLTSPSSALTNLASIGVSGTVDDVTARVTVNGALVTVGPGGTFATTVALVEGPNAIAVVATDLAGNAATAVRAITLDSIAPVVTVTAPASSVTTNQAYVVVSGTMDDPTATVLVNGIEVRPDASGAWSLALPLGEGANAITVSAVDAAGNRASDVTRSVTYAPAGGPGSEVASNTQAINTLFMTLAVGLLVVAVVLATLQVMLYRRLNRKLQSPGDAPSAPEDKEGL